MKRIIFIVFVFITTTISAQNVFFDNDPVLENFSWQVSQISEFMSRLNGESSISQTADSLSRKLDIVSLFKKETYVNNKRFVEDFVEKVSQCSNYINFSDTTWFAVAECVISTKSNRKGDKEILLALKTQEYGPYLYKWVITNAFGDVLSLEPDKRNPGLRISPTDNEVNFISLSHISQNEKRNILNYSSTYYKPEPLTVFFTLLYNGLIEIRYVKKLSYVFENIAGYRLNVNYFPGEEKNCGWLISEIQPVPEKVDLLFRPIYFYCK